MQPSDGGRELLDSLSRLRRETSVLAGQLAAGDDPQASHHGQDPTGLVKVTVDGTGAIIDVELDPSWRTRIDPRALANAVLTAYSAAGMERFGAWAKAVTNAEVQPPPAGAERADVTSVALDAPDVTSGRGLSSGMTVAEVLELLDRADAEIADLERRATERADQTTSWSGDGGKATVIMRGDQVVGLELEQERWAGIAHHREIAGEILDAFQRAAAGTATAEAELLAADSAVARIRELVGDHQPSPAGHPDPADDEPRGGFPR